MPVAAITPTSWLLQRIVRLSVPTALPCIHVPTNAIFAVPMSLRFRLSCAPYNVFSAFTH